jgi:hypothetical protein
MIVAEYSTRNFDFMVAGRDRAHAEELLLKAWEIHQEQYGPGVDPDLMREALADVGEVRFVEVAEGTMLRDGEPLS